MIPQKSFDAQMHIIRDVHFDVDKYKVGELYVINLKDPGYLSVQNKTIGQLREVNEHELKFKVLALNYDLRTGDSYNTYSIGGLRFTIDDVLERRIEIERLLTETEAAVYLASVFVKESTNDLFKSQIDWQKEMRHDTEYYCTPEKYQDDTSKECAKDIETKQSTLDPNDPKFNRLLGIVPDYSRFPYNYRTHTFTSGTPTAYKNDTTSNEDCEIESQKNSNIDRNEYICSFSFRERPVSFINDNGTFAYELFDNYKDGSFKVTLTKDNSIISMRISVKNFKADADTITFRNGNSTISITLHKDSFYKIFDNIKFEL